MVAPEKPGIEFPSVVDRAYQEYKRHLKVSDIMSTEVVVTTPQASMAETARIMGRKRIGSVIVTESGTPRGIFTERDLLSTLIAKGVSLGVPAGEVCSPMLVTAPAGISIHEAAKIMAAKHIRRLPLMKKKKLAGIITARDLVEAYAK